MFSHRYVDIWCGSPINDPRQLIWPKIDWARELTICADLSFADSRGFFHMCKYNKLLHWNVLTLSKSELEMEPLPAPSRSFESMSFSELTIDIHSPRKVAWLFQLSSVAFKFVHMLHSSWICCKNAIVLSEDMVKSLKGANTLCRYLTVADPPWNGPCI